MSAIGLSLDRVRADRLLSLVLLLQARGGATARALAAELEVSVRTVYRDLEALAAAGVPVLAQSGPGGGCRLMDGYRFPLRGLRPDEAEALLILGVPGVLRELGLDQALDAAHRQIRLVRWVRRGGGGWWTRPGRARRGPRAPGHAALVLRGAEEVPACGPGPRRTGSANRRQSPAHRSRGRSARVGGRAPGLVGTTSSSTAIMPR